MNLTGSSLPQLQEALGRLRSSTIPGLIAERVAAEPNAVAIRYKRGGFFREFTWSGYQAEIRRVAAGLIAAGLKPGDRLAIMGDVCIEYLLADLGATPDRRHPVRRLSDELAGRGRACPAACRRAHVRGRGPGASRPPARRRSSGRTRRSSIPSSCATGARSFSMTIRASCCSATWSRKAEARTASRGPQTSSGRSSPTPRAQSSSRPARPDIPGPPTARRRQT